MRTKFGLIIISVATKKPANFIVSILLILGFLSFASPSVTHNIQKASAACTTATLPTTYGVVTQSVTVATAGTYRVWSRIKAPNTTANSYYFQADGGCAYNVSDSTSVPSSTWTWVNYQDANTAAPVDISLTAGTHTLTYTGKEADVQLDKIMLLADTSCVPTSLGDNCATPTPTPTPPPPTPTPTPTPTPSPTPAPLPVSSVTASSADGVNVATNTIDNNLATRWSGCGDGQWIQYDLGSAQSVSSVKIAFYQGDTRTFKFDIAVSNDGATWTTVSANQQSATNLAIQNFSFAATTARYVRIVGHINSTGTCWNSYTEVQILGTSSTPTPPPPTPTPPPPTPTPTPTPGGIPDLIVTSISWTPASPATGNQVSFSATIKNQGTAATPNNVKHGLAFSVDGTVVNWNDNNLSSLAAGASRVQTANGGPTGSATWGATAGTHTILANIDDSKIIAEGNETNNTLTSSITVGSTPTPPPPTPNPTPGDVNGDGRVNAIDLSALISHDGQNYPAADFNGDGTVGAADMAILLSKWTW